MIDRIIESDAELKENYAIITSIKGVARQNGACLLIFTNNFRFLTVTLFISLAGTGCSLKKFNPVVC